MKYYFVLGIFPENTSKMDYYPVVHQPINEPSTIRKILRINAKATEEVGQLYVITHVDEGVYQRMMPIVWSELRLYIRHIFFMGDFHTSKNYYGRLGHKVAYSGFQDILIEANLTTGGTLNGILACSGTLYSKTSYIYRVVGEALERLLYKEFRNQNKTPNQEAVDEILLNLIKSPSKETLDFVTENAAVKAEITAYLKFQKDVREGCLGPTAQYWMTVLDDINRAIYLDIAVKTNNFDLWKWCVHEMSCLFSVKMVKTIRGTFP